MRRLARMMVLAAAAGLGLFVMTGAPVQTGHAEDAPDPSVVATFRGSDKAVLGPFDLHAGLTVIRARSNGTANFVVYLVMPAPGEDVTQSYGNRYLFIDAVGAYDGAAADIAKHDGSYYLEVSQASGAYQLTVSQPMPDTVTPVNQQSFDGHGQQVTPVFALPAGSHTVTAQADAYALRVRMYRLDDLGGGPVVSGATGYYGDELIDTTIPPGYTSVTVDLPADGLYVLYVNAEGTESLNWTVSVQ